jgi:hypothetical protein
LAAAHRSDGGGRVFNLEAAAAQGRSTATAAVFRVLRRRLKEERWRLVLGFGGGGSWKSGGGGFGRWLRRSGGGG